MEKKDIIGQIFDCESLITVLLSKNLSLSDHFTQEKLKPHLKKAFDESELDCENILYVYRLEGETIKYPIKNGDILYIGETKDKQDRFFHIYSSKTWETGNNTKSNYTLSQYYHLGKSMILDIYVLPKDANREALEKLVNKAHMKEYGALPMATSAGGSEYTAKALLDIVLPPYDDMESPNGTVQGGS